MQLTYENINIHSHLMLLLETLSVNKERVSETKWNCQI